MAFTESLTVRILGDSSDFQRELSAVTGQLEQLERRITGAGRAGNSFGEMTERLSSAMRPLQQLSTRTSQVGQQLQAISRQPVMLNVQPALQALQQVLRMAQQVIQQLRSVSTLAAGRSGLLQAVPPRMSLPGFSTGGLVAGPAGEDRVPARLTAGEFVLRKPAVTLLGSTFLEQLNRDPVQAAASLWMPSSPSRNVRPAQQDAPGSDGLLPSHRIALAAIRPEIPDLRSTAVTSPAATPSVRNPSGAQGRAYADSGERLVSQTTNQFGGIEIHVREAAEVGELMLDLKRQGLGLKARRG